jgi:anaerobic ribonucleoside-triphosphate reductase activating protein
MAIINASCVDFKGWSTVLQVSGCSHGCSGCFNTSSHNPKSGQLFTEDTYQELQSYLDKPYINNLVLQGGDPLFKRNVPEILKLCKRIKNELQDKNIVLFTGYTLTQIQSSQQLSPILSTIDYLVDGKFEKDLKVSGKFFGSSNQRIYHITDSGENIVDVTDTF